MTLDQVKRLLSFPRPGGTVIFLGAGFSLGATNADGNCVPLARDFANSLSAQIGEELNLPLSIVADIFAEKNQGDPGKLIKLIRETFSTRDVTDQQRQVMRYPWKRVYTTNYDDVAEKCDPDSTLRSRSYTRDQVPFSFEGKTLIQEL